MRNVKKKDNEQWIELCEYVKKEILEYDDNMKFPQYLALKLQGIKRGEHIANNNHEAKANYDDYTILCTFKLCKRKIVTYLHENEKKIKDEKHKINLIMKMIEPEINDVYLRLQNVKKTEERVESKDFNNQSNENGLISSSIERQHKKGKGIQLSKMGEDFINYIFNPVSI